MLEEYLLQLKKEFPKLRFINKRQSASQRLIDVVLKIVTFGAQNAYLTQYVTTLGSHIFLPDGWDERSNAEKYIVLRHEAVHLRQFKKYTWLGMAFFYTLPILPMGLAWGRARLEWEAYAETLSANAECYGIEAARDPELHAHIIRQFCSGAYGWMWPFPGTIKKWIRGHVSMLDRIGTARKMV